MPKISDHERALRRQRFVDAAWRCLARQSYRELRVEDVCVEAAQSKGAFYGYFPAKADLLYALVDDDAVVMEIGVARVAATGDPRAGLRRFARVVLRDAEDVARVQLRADVWALLVDDPELERRLRASVARRRAIVRGWIAEAVDRGALAEAPANALASVLLALADGLALHHRLDPAACGWGNVRTAIDVLLAGLGPA